MTEKRLEKVFERNDFFGLDVMILTERGTENACRDWKAVQVAFKEARKPHSPGGSAIVDCELPPILRAVQGGFQSAVETFGAVEVKALDFNGANRADQGRICGTKDGCGEFKPHSEFHVGQKKCRTCQASYQRKWNQAKRERTVVILAEQAGEKPESEVA